MLAAAFTLLMLAAGAALLRLMRGPTIVDRIVALDVLLITLMVGLVTRAAERGDSGQLVAVAVIAVVGFAATVAASLLSERELR